MRRPSLTRFRELAQGQLFNASNVDDNGSALFQSVMCLVVHRQSAFSRFPARTELIMPTACTMPLADTLSLSLTLAPLAVACSPRLRDRLTGCVCLHALSSFQRTDRRCAQGAPQG